MTMEQSVQGGLTMAELDSMDIYGSDEAQAAVARAYGRHIDDLESFKEHLTLFDRRAKEFQDDHLVYERLRDTSKGIEWVKEDSQPMPESTIPFKRIGQTLLEAAGGHIQKRRELLQRQKVSYETRGEKLSKEIGGYILGRLPNQDAVFVASQLYYINEGYFISRKPKPKEDDKWVCRVFAGSETTREFSMKHYGQAGDGNKRKLFPKIAEARHWHEWLHDIEVAANS